MEIHFFPKPLASIAVMLVLFVSLIPIKKEELVLYFRRI
jgi:hypothetical protein